MKVFECKMCGQCCKGEGGVYLTEDELSRVADFLDMTVPEFKEVHCVRKNGRIYVRTKTDGFCSLFDGSCTVHPVKPRSCWEWPFYPAMLKDPANWEVAKENCPGVNPECTYEEFVAQGNIEIEHRRSKRS